MRGIPFTVGQKQRLKELDVNEAELNKTFSNVESREEAFRKLSGDLVKRQKKRLIEWRRATKRLPIKILENKLIESIRHLGFVEVTTPTIVPKSFIERMGIRFGDHLWKQILWVNEKRCLRPMLAPNLYFVMANLRKLWKPVRIFEVGSCFRKDTKGQRHLEEFTMLNLVELAPEVNPMERLRELISQTMGGLGVKNYEVKSEKAEVYGSTTDIIVNGVEVASAATGPIDVDRNWSIVDPWVGIGFGLERLTMAVEKCGSITKVGRSLVYVGECRLDIK